MAEAFLGLKVSVLLHSGIKLEGEVSQIEPLNQQMTLKDVSLFIFGQPPHRTPVYGVFGKDVKDLQVLSTQTTNYLDNHVLEQIPPQQQKVVTPTKSVSKNRKNKQQSNNNIKRNGNEGWAGEDVDIFREEEFDFQKNLNMFDKAKIFAEIRESDETAQEELLVTLNRLPQKKVNLLPTENVLDNINNEDDDGDESDNDSQTPNEDYIQKKKRLNRDIIKSDGVIITTKSTGIICSTVSPLQMAHVEHECTKASDSFEELSIENGGRGSALLILQLFNHPSVVILVGNNKNGAIGLVCARHLMNHGCKVTVCITSKEENLCNAIIKYKSIAERFGVIISYNLNNLQQGNQDLVVDSILGSDEKLIDIQDKSTFHIICESIHWANNQSNIPILSIDFPSGIDPSTGKPHHTEYFIKPNWTLSLGAPKNGCKSHLITGDLYLVDIGIPRLCWKRIGIKGNTIPWGADFLVALEYK